MFKLLSTLIVSGLLLMGIPQQSSSSHPIPTFPYDAPLITPFAFTDGCMISDKMFDLSINTIDQCTQAKGHWEQFPESAKVYDPEDRGHPFFFICDRENETHCIDVKCVGRNISIGPGCDSFRKIYTPYGKIQVCKDKKGLIDTSATTKEQCDLIKGHFGTLSELYGVMDATIPIDVDPVSGLPPNTNYIEFYPTQTSNIRMCSKSSTLNIDCELTLSWQFPWKCIYKSNDDSNPSVVSMTCYKSDQSK